MAVAMPNPAIVSVFYILRVLAAMYAKPGETSGPLPGPGATGWLAVALSALFMLGLGLAPMPVLDAALAFKALP
jgi:NADH:ubiquinone oxidoreductase subunit 2 (subunit N)